MSKPSLTALIREVLSEHPDDPAQKVARLVAERTPAGELEQFYAFALEPLVDDVIRQSRNSAMNSKKRHSPKQEERRSWWSQMLSQRVSVGSELKRLGDCSVEDLNFCISMRRDQVGALLGQIAKFEAIRDAVLAHGVETVSELPEGAVEL